MQKEVHLGDENIRALDHASVPEVGTKKRSSMQSTCSSASGPSKAKDAKPLSNQWSGTHQEREEAVLQKKRLDALCDEGRAKMSEEAGINESRLLLDLEEDMNR